jgi:hypothetical protein
MLRRFAETPLVSEGVAAIDRALDDNPALEVTVGPSAESFSGAAWRLLGYLGEADIRSGIRQMDMQAA